VTALEAVQTENFVTRQEPMITTIKAMMQNKTPSLHDTASRIDNIYYEIFKL
jgi:hypothetical protein